MPATRREARRDILSRLLEAYERSKSYGRPAPWQRDIAVRLDPKEFPEAFGPEGREKQLERMTREHLERLGRKHPGVISEVEGIGAMIAFRIGDGALKSTREFIQRCFEAGLVLYYGGHDPACIRLFLPAGVVTDEEIREAFAIMDRCLG